MSDPEISNKDRLGKIVKFVHDFFEFGLKYKLDA